MMWRCLSKVTLTKLYIFLIIKRFKLTNLKYAGFIYISIFAPLKHGNRITVFSQLNSGFRDTAVGFLTALVATVQALLTS